MQDSERTEFAELAWSRAKTAVVFGPVPKPALWEPNTTHPFAILVAPFGITQEELHRLLAWKFMPL